MTGNPSGCSSSATPNIGEKAPSGHPNSTALFPGAFRPPHINHYETVRRLAERPDVDEVIVIISDRPRDVPGTTKALDVGASREIWDIYLRGLDGGRESVKVETATGSAVAMATERVQAGRPGDRFLLVFGDPDLAAGRERFGKALRQRPDGVEASVERGAPNPRPVRATELRALLAEGDGAFHAFCCALPDHLSAEEQRQVWTACRGAMVDRRALTVARIRQVLETNGIGPVGRIVPAGRPKTDQVYRCTLDDGVAAFVKYADDATRESVANRVTDSAGRATRKPRDRLMAERDALKWVHRNVESPVLVPDVVCHDKAARTLALSAVCCGGCRLGDELRAGIFDAVAARAAGQFLAAAHTAAPPTEPFWDGLDEDRRQWEAALTALTTPPRWSYQRPTISARLARLADVSMRATGRWFCHLDYSPNNVMRAAGAMAIIDFERSTTCGDPAFDLATQLGHYLAAGLVHRQPDRCRAMIEAALDGYRTLADDRWAEMASRVAAFTAATTLHIAASSLKRPFARPPVAVLDVCNHLLALLDEPDPHVVHASLIDCFAAGRGGLAGTTSKRGAVRRRSLKPLNTLSLWEGSLIDHAQRGVTTVAIHGGRPRSIVEIHVDGVWVAGPKLDSVGSATTIISAAPDDARIEISDLDEPVLEGSLSPMPNNKIY